MNIFDPFGFAKLLPNALSNDPPSTVINVVSCKGYPLPFMPIISPASPQNKDPKDLLKDFTSGGASFSKARTLYLVLSSTL